MFRRKLSSAVDTVAIVAFVSGVSYLAVSAVRHAVRFIWAAVAWLA